MEKRLVQDGLCGVSGVNKGVVYQLPVFGNHVGLYPMEIPHIYFIP